MSQTNVINMSAHSSEQGGVDCHPNCLLHFAYCLLHFAGWTEILVCVAQGRPKLNSRLHQWCEKPLPKAWTQILQNIAQSLPKVGPKSNQLLPKMGPKWNRSGT